MPAESVALNAIACAAFHISMVSPSLLRMHHQSVSASTVSIDRNDLSHSSFITITTSFAMQHNLCFDPNRFPHIVEAILSRTDRSTLLAVRLVSSSLCDIADRLLSGDTLSIWSRAEGSSTLLSVTGLARVRHPQNRCIPCFHSAGSETTQGLAVNRAKRLNVYCFLATQRLHQLLQQAGPRCDILLTFGRDHLVALATDVILPPCASLQLVAYTDCSCMNSMDGSDDSGSGSVDGSGSALVEDSEEELEAAASTFSHSAAEVTLHLESEPFGPPPLASTRPACPVAQGAINSGIERLQVTGNIRALPRLFDGVDVQTSPDLHIVIAGDGKLDSAEVDALLLDTARCFSVPAQQVQYELKRWSERVTT